MKYHILLILSPWLFFASNGLAAGQVGLKKPYAVKVIKEIPYYQGKGATRHHRLDVYLPVGKKEYPVMFFVHGGAWRHGDKEQFGLYTMLGRSMARNGIAMVSTNYRLTPPARHPDHVVDVARAFAWTYRNIAKYGGRPNEIFVCGHSAGGHLTALMATDDRYLKAENLTLKAIRGVIPVSGAHRITRHTAFTAVFGEKLKEASPITHARKDAPPFLLIYADRDLPGCGRKVNQAFFQALHRKKALAQILEVKNRNHLSIIIKATQDQDQVNRAIRNFIMTHVVFDRVAEGPSGFDILGEYLLLP